MTLSTNPGEMREEAQETNPPLPRMTDVNRILGETSNTNVRNEDGFFIILKNTLLETFSARSLHSLFSIDLNTNVSICEFYH